MNMHHKDGFVRQSYAGVIRQRLKGIEKQIAFGVRHEAIRRDLAAAGFEAPLNTFRKSLWRARVWWRNKAPLVDSFGAHFGRYALPGTGASHGGIAQAQSVNVAPNAQDSPQTALTARVVPAAKQSDSTHAAERRSETPKPEQAQAARANRPDLDRFFKRKSVLAKPTKPSTSS